MRQVRIYNVHECTFVGSAGALDARRFCSYVDAIEVISVGKGAAMAAGRAAVYITREYVSCKL